MHEVAVFDLAQKIAMTALVPLQMLNQALFPHIAKHLIGNLSISVFD